MLFDLQVVGDSPEDIHDSTKLHTPILVRHQKRECSVICIFINISFIHDLHNNLPSIQNLFIFPILLPLDIKNSFSSLLKD